MEIPGRIVLIGDSIRMGYQGVVRESLHGAEVLGPQANCRTSRSILEHMDDWVISQQPQLVHINCGLHDIRRVSPSDAQAVSPQEYESNVREILRRIIRHNGAKIIWATTTPVNQQRHQAVKGFSRLEADVVSYNRIAVAVASDSGAAVNDLFALVAEAGADALLTGDGVHFTEDGYRLLGQAVARRIQQAIAAP